MARTEKIAIEVNADARDAQKGLRGTERSLDKLTKTAKIAGVGVAAGLAVGLAATVKFAASAVSAASDLNETISKTDQIFGKASRSVQKFAKSAARNYGISQQAAMDAAATFGVFGKSAGKTGGDLAEFSTDLVATAADMASFGNTTPEEAIEALGSALRGEAEPIRKYGVLLDDATLRQEAVRKGITKTTKSALTPQQKILAAQSAIYKQLGDQQGDFARTQGSMANQQRIVAAQFENIKTVIGQALLPVAVAFFGLLIKLTPALSTLADTLSTALGPPVAQAGALLAQLMPSLQALGAQFAAMLPGILAAGEGVRATLLPVMTDLAGIVVDSILPALAAMAAMFVTKVLPPVQRLAQVVAAKVMPIIKLLARILTAVLVPAFDVVSTIVGEVAAALAENLGPAIDAVRPLFVKLDDALKKNKPTIDTMVDVVKFLAHVLGDILGMQIRVFVVPAIKLMVGIISAGIDMFQAWLDILDPVIRKVQELIDWLSKIKAPKISLPKIPGLNSAATGAAGVGFPPAPQLAGPGVGGRASMATSSDAGVTINVYGILDAADAARKIRAILRDDNRRQSGAYIRGLP